jgi:hypothetical protein
VRKISTERANDGSGPRPKGDEPFSGAKSPHPMQEEEEDDTTDFV